MQEKGEGAAIADLPNGTVTFLFTDIEDSTGLLRRLGQSYATVLEEHRRVLRSATEARGGQAVDTQGDTFFAAFRRASDAVEAAVVAQRALAAHLWPDGAPLRVRMGLHTGQPTLTGSGYVGLDVHRAARLCAAGHGGQILVSQTIYHLMADALPKGTDLRRLGKYWLKGLARPEDVYQLVAPGLPAHFPRLRSPLRRAAAPSPPTFDVFLCHNAVDKPMIESIAGRLKQDGLEPWLDTWCLTPGGAWQDEIVAGLRGSAACAVFVGPRGLGDWSREELGLALERRAAAPGFRVFPVLLPGLPEPFDATTLPPQLGAHTWVDLRAGIDDPRAFQRLVNAVKGLPLGPAGPTESRDDTCPYRGLQTFDEEHASFFFGRDGDVQRLLEKLKAARSLAVVAPSGTGKSSVVRAGLIPALRRGGLPGSEAWPIYTITPGERPLSALASQLPRLGRLEAMPWLRDQLAADERTLHLTVSSALASRPPAERVVWVIDQFEEVFTQCWDEQERAPFLANLLYAAAIPEGRNVVVLTMRADFYPRCAAYPELAGHVAAHQYLVSPMDEDGLRQAIEEPARRVGLQLEPGLTETILDDVADEPGALPLLEHALLELWEQRRHGRLTLEGYRESGGVQGAIAKRAEAIYSRFSSEGRAIVRRVMLRLTQPGEGTEDTRRRVAMSELVTRAGEQAAIERVVGELADARLVTLSGDLPVDLQPPGSGEGWVEVAHEALIRSWPRLREWIDEDRAALRVHRRLTEAAREWQRLERDEGVLYRGTRLAEALEWRERHEASLNDLEREFLVAGVTLQDRERAAERHRRHMLTLGLSLGLVAALVLSGVAGLQARQADEQRQVAVARELAFQADAVRKGSAVLLPRSLLLAAETLKRFTMSRETEPTLRQALALLAHPITRLDHPARVQAVAYSPDGRYLATAGADGARMWEASDGHEIAHLPQDGAVQAVAWSPDGRYLATAGDDRTARLWQVEDGREVARLAHDDRVYAVGFSPDGRLLATASDDGSARVWEAPAGREIAHVTHAAPVLARYSPDGGNQFTESTAQSIAFSPDGRYLATARTADGTARVWETAGGREVARLQHGDLVVAVAFSPDGRYLASGSVDGTARLWEAASGREIDRMAIERSGPVFTLAFSPDGRYLAIGGRGSITRVLEVTPTGGQDVASLWHDDSVQAVTWSPDGRYLATASNDRTARVWEVNSGREVVRMPIETASVVYGVAFSPDGRYLATASDDRAVRVWEAIKPWQVAGLAHDDSVIFVAYSPDGRLLASTSGNTARIWDATSGQELRRLTTPAIAWAIDFSPDSRLLATSGFDGWARIWDVASGQEVARFQHGENVRVFGLRFSPDGRLLATTGQQGNVKVWEVSSGREVMQATHDAAAGYPRFGPDGRYLATGSVDRTARIWDLATGQEVRRMQHDYPLNDLAISPDGRYLAAGDDRVARVWEMASGREVLNLPHDNAVNGVAFSPDGRYLATAARNGIARVWEVASGRQVAGMAHDQPMNGLAFSPDGRYLATASNDHTVRVWDPILADPVAEACASVSRNLTPEEWRQYLRDEPYRKTCPDLP